MISAFFSVGTDEFTKTRARAFCRLVFVLENVGTIVNAVVF